MEETHQSTTESIITHINDTYPFFNMREHLLGVLQSLEKYSPAVSTDAECLFNYLNDTMKVLWYCVFIVPKKHTYYGTVDERYVGTLGVCFLTDTPVDLDSFKEIYPSTGIVKIDEDFSYTFSIDIPNPEKVISDTELIAEFRRVRDLDCDTDVCLRLRDD